MSKIPAGLAVFDLDGTLLRNSTACEMLALPLGRKEEMERFERLSSREEIADARREMASWYQDVSTHELLGSLESSFLAPGAAEGIALLREHEWEVAIASITWEFAVAWFAERPKVVRYIGTRLEADGGITHFWPHDKAQWVRELAQILSLPMDRTAAVGDSNGDVFMLQTVARSVFVGAALPDQVKDAAHMPGADILSVAQYILDIDTDNRKI